MNKSLVWALVIMFILIIGIVVGIYFLNQSSLQQKQEDEAAVRNVVEQFGKKLQNVPLLAEQDIVVKSIQDEYANFVSQELLSIWKQNPQTAPGRLTSSPWPDRIEIISLVEKTPGTYEVNGNIIEITSQEVASGGFFAKREVVLKVEKNGSKWLITSVVLGPYSLNEGPVKLVSPTSSQTVSSPLTVKGQARGTWFFEASFPMKITDLNGNIISQSFVQAKGEWMTENFVEFEGGINFENNGPDKPAILVMQKDNPAGLPQFDAEVRLPIILKGK